MNILPDQLVGPVDNITEGLTGQRVNITSVQVRGPHVSIKGPPAPEVNVLEPSANGEFRLLHHGIGYLLIPERPNYPDHMRGDGYTTPSRKKPDSDPHDYGYRKGDGYTTPPRKK